MNRKKLTSPKFDRFTQLTKWAHSWAMMVADDTLFPSDETPGVYNRRDSLYVMIPQCSVAPDP